MTVDRLAQALDACIADIELWMMTYHRQAGSVETISRAREALAAYRSKAPAEGDAAKVQAMRAALDFAAGAIGDAIYTEDGLDGDAGQRVLHIITEAHELGTFDQQQFGALDHLCPFTRAEKAEAALSAVQPKETAFDAIQRALDLASLHAGSVAANDRDGAAAHRHALRDHLIAWMQPASTQAPAPAHPAEWRTVVAGAHAFLAAIKSSGCEVKFADGSPTPNALLMERLHRELGELLAAPCAAVGAEQPWQAMLYAPRDGSKIELLVEHREYWIALKAGRADGYRQACEGHWVDFNGGGWSWMGTAGQPVGWRPLGKGEPS